MAVQTEPENQARVRYATRIPILKGRREVIGYKLLFNSHISSYRPAAPVGDTARNAIDLASLIGLKALCDDRLAFLDCDRETLLSGLLWLLPPNEVVAELPPDLVVDEAVRKACIELSDRGYQFALGNFSANDPRQPLAGLASFLKVNLATTTLYDATSIVREFSELSALLAENVDTHEALEIASGMGFEYFQGYFFRKPNVVSARRFPPNQIVEMQLFQEICREPLRWDRIEELLKHDPSLYYRLLRYANSALVAVRGEVKSIQQVLFFLGDREFSRWCRLTLTFDLSRAKPSDIVLAALVRGRFCELIGEQAEHGDADLFLLGLFSLIDAILDVPMLDVLEGLPLATEARTLLLEHEGPLAPFFRLMFCMEAGNWEQVWPCCNELGITEEFAAGCYHDAIEWAYRAVVEA